MAKRTFEDWLKELNAWVMRLVGLSYEDLPDCCYADWYEDGMSPRAAARKALYGMDGQD